MKPLPNPLGTIDISYHAIATLVIEAALQSYGVVGIDAGNWWERWWRWWRGEGSAGVKVSLAEGQITVDVYLVIEYGTRLNVVAQSAAANIRLAIEKALGVPVGAVNVHVRGLRVSNTDA